MANGDAGGSSKLGQTTLGKTRKKLTPGEANFRQSAGLPNFRCGDCFFYEHGTCRVVAVEPNANDICDNFEPNTRGGMTSTQTSGATIARTDAEPVLSIKHLLITKVAEDRQTGEKRWFAKASGTEWDLYNERMSVELFRDFIKRAERRDAVPEPFSSKAWVGGLPYLGVAHYLDQDGFGIIGRTKQLWVDGNTLKARGEFEKSPIAQAAYESIHADIKNNVPLEQRVRISIAFLDWQHEHEGFGSFSRKSLADRCELCSKGTGGKVYKAGHLVHLATTRIPAYPSASIELEAKSMGKKSKRHADAESIVGKFADELEERDQKLVGRSASAGIDPSAVVIRQEKKKKRPWEKGKDEEEAPADEEETPAEEAPAEGEETPAEEAPAEEAPAEGEEAPPVEGEEAPVEDEEEEDEDEEYPPFGGAKSLAEAEAYLVKRAKSAPVLMDSLNVLAGVLSNIAGAEHRGPIRRALADYQTRLDSEVVKTLGDVRSILKEATMSDEPVTQPTTPVAGAEAAAVAAEATALVEAEQVHVLDEALLNLRAAFDEARATPVDAKARLGMLQQAVDVVAVAVAKNIGDQPAVATAGVSPDALAAAVQMAVAPLVAELAAVKGLISKAAPGAPVRRAIQPGSLLTARTVVGQAPSEVIMEADRGNTQTDKNVTPGLRSLVRRTVFGNGGG